MSNKKFAQITRVGEVVNHSSSSKDAFVFSDNIEDWRNSKNRIAKKEHYEERRKKKKS